MAGKILVKLAIAKLVQPEDLKEIVQVNELTHLGNDEDGHKNTSNMLYKVAKKEEISPNIFRVKFKNPNTQFRISVSGINTFGRHFLVNSPQNQVSRYYTICNCMSSENYPRYIHTLNKILGKEDNAIEGEQESKGKIK